jgi:cytoskeletal protein RodZ
MAEPIAPPDIQAGGVGEEKKESNKKKWIIILLVLLLLGGLGWYGYTYFFQSDEPVPEETIPVEVQAPAPAPAPTTPPSNTVTDKEALFGTAQYVSESFKVGDIAIGGEAELILLEDSPEPLTISGVRGESFTEKNNQGVKLVLTWTTNKLAKSVIQYSKAGQEKQEIGESDYSFSHSMIIPGLEQASTYIYVINAEDRFGNKISSDSYAVSTGSKTVSLFDLIAGAIGDTFGWAVAK